MREEVFVWTVWSVRCILGVPLLRMERLNAFLMGNLLAGFFVCGVLGVAGIDGPSTIAGGFAAVWLIIFACLLGLEWVVVRHLWPLKSQ